MADRLVLSEAQRREILAHARAEAPKECCGLLAGRNGVVSSVIRCTNASPTPELRYQLRELRRVIEIEDAGEELVGIYHSHPRSPAYPSPTDRQDAHWPDAFYVLVSLRDPDPSHAAELFAYRIHEHDLVKQVEIVAKQ